MSVFIALVAALLVLSTIALTKPLLRPPEDDATSSQQLNTAIYKDQLATLERDLANGNISAADHEATRDELQLRLLDDTRPTENRPHSTGFWSSGRTALVIALGLPLLSLGSYYWLGNAGAITPGATQAATALQISQMVESLEAKLQAEPQNFQGWAMLARSYKVMGRLDEAEQAYEKSMPALENNPDLLVDFAELLAIQAQHHMDGRPADLVRQALDIDPEHPSALMMSGVVAYQRQDFGRAIQEWEKLLSLLDPASEDARMTQENLDDARAQNASAQAPAARP